MNPLILEKISRQLSAPSGDFEMHSSISAQSTVVTPIIVFLKQQKVPDGVWYLLLESQAMA